MGIVRRTNRRDIEALGERRVALMEKALIERLRVIGERVVYEAINLPSPDINSLKIPPTSQAKHPKLRPHQPNYVNWTWDLRGSIGGVVTRNGSIVSEFGFDGGSVDGAYFGKEFARRLVDSFSSGISLIVVAGMHYALYVRHRGYDVITSAELKAEELVPTMLRELGIAYQK